MTNRKITLTIEEGRREMAATFEENPWQMAVTIASQTVSREHSDRSSAGERRAMEYATDVVENPPSDVRRTSKNSETRETFGAGSRRQDFSVCLSPSGVIWSDFS
jgi:hypothetical protein